MKNYAPDTENADAMTGSDSVKKRIKHRNCFYDARYE